MVKSQRNRIELVTRPGAELLPDLDVGQCRVIRVKGGLVECREGRPDRRVVFDAPAQKLGHPPALPKVVMGLLGDGGGDVGRWRGVNAVARSDRLADHSEEVRPALEVAQPELVAARGRGRSLDGRETRQQGGAPLTQPLNQPTGTYTSASS